MVRDVFFFLFPIHLCVVALVVIIWSNLAIIKIMKVGKYFFGGEFWFVCGVKNPGYQPVNVGVGGEKGL
jgi:hypothetical protein